MLINEKSNFFEIIKIYLPLSEVPFRYIGIIFLRFLAVAMLILFVSAIYREGFHLMEILQDIKNRLLGVLIVSVVMVVVISLLYAVFTGFYRFWCIVRYCNNNNKSICKLHKKKSGDIRDILDI